jgi:hypothetical protein
METTIITGKDITIGNGETRVVYVESENISGQVSTVNVYADTSMNLAAEKLLINTDGGGATYIGNDVTTIDLVSSRINVNVEGAGPVYIGNDQTTNVQLRAETVHVTGDSALCIHTPHIILRSQENKESMYTFARTGQTEPAQSLVIYQIAFPLNTMVQYDLTICGKTHKQAGVWTARGHLVCQKAGEQTVGITGDSPLGEVCIHYDAATGLMVEVKGHQESASWVVTGRLTRL